MALVEGIILLSVLFYLLFRRFKRPFEYWSEKGVQQLPIWQALYYNIPGQASQKDVTESLYRQIEQKRFIGISMFQMPFLFLRDPELIKQVMVKDFDHFVNRNGIVNEKFDPLFGRILFFLRDKRWRAVRNTLTPGFTSAKMKTMFLLLDEWGRRIDDHIESTLKSQVESDHPDGDQMVIEFKEALMRKFTCDMIASVAFGLNVDSVKDPDNEFYKMARYTTDFTGRRFFFTMLMFIVPSIIKFFNLTLYGDAPVKFYKDIITETMKVREEKKIYRPDMIHMLMQAKQGTLNEDNIYKEKPEVSEDDLISQAFFFVAAGFETTANTISFAAHELALNPDIQEKLQQEIDRVVEEDGGKITYDGVVNKMKYLDMVVSETLRKWTPTPSIDREVSKRYVIPKTETEPEVVLDVGDLVLIPVAGLHSDPKYYPDPDKFDPERFSDENKSKIHNSVYLPFGAGPRSCIGNRFALMQMKTCLVHILKKYSIHIVSKTQNPLVLKKASIFNDPVNGFWLGIKSR